MARGWESKSVEEQQSIASQDVQGKRTAEDAQKASAKRSLELQISRVEAQLAAAKSNRHREMLQQALADLRQQLSAL